MLDLKKMKTLRKVTYPFLKWSNGEPVGLLISSQIFKGEEMKKKKGETMMEPANLFHAYNVADGVEYEVIVNTVLKSKLEEAYPNHSYIGRLFKITQSRDKTKRYNEYAIEELELPIELIGVVDPASDPEE